MSAAGLALALGGFGVLLAGRLHVLLHLFQQEHYEPARLRVWVRRRGERVHRAELAAVGVLGAATIAAAAADFALTVVLIGIFALVVGSRVGVGLLRRDQIKPLVF